jgi:hypothetical protein
MGKIIDPLISACKVGQELFRTVTENATKIDYVNYEYRHINGQLFSTKAPNLFTARARKKEWLKQFSKPIASLSIKDLMLEAQKQIESLTLERNKYFSLLKYLETDTKVPSEIRRLITKTVTEK